LNESGIIYCLTIKDVEEVSQKLKGLTVKADSYDAHLNPQLRSSVHQKWYQNKCQGIVATVAFGMGINKLDLRFVVHYSMSKSYETIIRKRVAPDMTDNRPIVYYFIGLMMPFVPRV
jgi:superfamily II DNA helicase RecQ